MLKVHGGEGASPDGICNGKGDVILCTIVADVVVCMHFEAGCPEKFVSDCTPSKVTITCPSQFTIGK